MSFGDCLSLLVLLIWVYLALGRGRFWLPLEEPFIPPLSEWPSVDIIIPARDEADVLALTLPALLKQSFAGVWRIILVNDHSGDGTAEVAKNIVLTSNNRLSVIDAPALREGWSGKLAALDAGVAVSSADFILFTDADILHDEQSLERLVARAQTERLDLVSLMVKLSCEGFAENLLIPAFVFFFAMLYPFRWAADSQRGTAAAAGGVMLVRRSKFNETGGLKHISSKLIDDCALAALIKGNGGSIELTLSGKVKSLRHYGSITEIKQMIARTAFTQLQHSTKLLLGTILGLSLLFFGPLVFALAGESFEVKAGLLTWLLMALLYLPMVRFYRISWVWAIMLPAAAFVYVSATVQSARLYWRGQGGSWKGRSQA